MAISNAPLNPDSPPAFPSAHDLERARLLLPQWLVPTRLIEARSLSASLGKPVFLKLESQQPTGSFKVRGALYALWSRLETHAVPEVVASSTGNHGAAVAFAARTLAVRAMIFLPEKHNEGKRKIIESLGAEVTATGRDVTEATAAARNYAESRAGSYFLHDAEDAQVPAGPGTITFELFEQLPEAKTIVVPVGDSALLRGVAAAARHLGWEVKLAGVQARNAPAYYLSWRDRAIVPTEECDTIADGLATRQPLEANVTAIVHSGATLYLVTEEELLRTIRLLAVEEKLIVEPAAAAAAAVLLDASFDLPGPVVAVMTGCNIAEPVLRRALCS